MVARVQLRQALARNMGVDGGGRNIGMAQEQLDRPQIGAMIEQVRRKCMAQRVR